MSRPFGGFNKNRERLFKTLAKEYGDDWNPILMMAKNAALLQVDVNSIDTASELSADDVIKIQDANREWEKIAPYVQAKLKSLEVTGDSDNPVGVAIINILPIPNGSSST